MWAEVAGRELAIEAWSFRPPCCNLGAPKLSMTHEFTPLFWGTGH